MTHPISAFSECDGCGFVLQAESCQNPDPKHWDECPDCGGTDFSFPFE